MLERSAVIEHGTSRTGRWLRERRVRVAIWVAVNGYLDEVPTDDVPRFQEELREYLRTEGSIYAQIRDAGDLPGDLEESLKGEVEKFGNTFSVQEKAAV